MNTATITAATITETDTVIHDAIVNADVESLKTDIHDYIHLFTTADQPRYGKEAQAALAEINKTQPELVKQGLVNRINEFAGKYKTFSDREKTSVENLSRGAGSSQRNLILRVVHDEYKGKMNNYVLNLNELNNFSRTLKHDLGSYIEGQLGGPIPRIRS